jgi:CBS domain-containing protein
MKPDERTVRLSAIRDSLVTNAPVESLTVREFIWWFGAERRGYKVTWRIRRHLEKFDLRTVPDFDAVHIDSRIRFAINLPPLAAASAPKPVVAGKLVESLDGVTPEPPIVEVQPEPVVYIGGAATEPAFRVSRLLAASTKPLSVRPDCTLREAVTLMLRHDFSQLPVMTNERDVKGVVSWDSIAPKLVLRDDRVQVVRDCMKQPHEVLSTDSLFRVIGRIIEHSYVLVRGEDRTISGIVTTTDLSLQFQQLSEPFLLLSEIENHIRLLIDGKFTADEFNSVKELADTDRIIETVADLTFGEYIRLLEKPENWDKTLIQVDRKVFVKELDKVRLIRNDVMHFDPDGITLEDHRLLSHFVQFLHEMRFIQG